MKPVTKDDLLKYVPLKREIENRMEYLARMKSHEFYPEAKETDGSQHTGTASDANAKAIEHRLEYEESIAPVSYTHLYWIRSPAREKRPLRKRNTSGKKQSVLPWQ